jgi:radical SAM superfamily enzyme YgiQ (UPF0313 family)
MKRVLLVNPPFYRLLGSHYNANSLGIAYIASVLNKNGHDAWLYNADFQDKAEYQNLKELYQGFHDYKKYFENPQDHPIWKEVVDKILDFQPDIVGYTSYTANISSIDIISKAIRWHHPKAIQVIGGPHSTLDKGILGKLPAIDFAVAREGEQVMLDLCNGKPVGEIQGLAYRNKLGFIQHSGDAEVLDIDSLPFPERDKFWGITEEQKKTIDVSYVVTIRGCPYRCNYCASPYSWKRNKTQYRSPDSVIAELHHLKENYWNDKEYDYSASANIGPKSGLRIIDNTIVYFVDDVFTVNKKRVKEILQRMIDEGLDMPWKCEARADHLNEEICELMAKAGCQRVKVGFESGSDRILKQIQKDETTEKMRHGARLLKDAGVPFTAYFMAGFPGETDEDLKQTIAFAKEIEADFYSLSVLSPYFGTKLYYNLIDEGYPLDKEPWEYFYHQATSMMVNDTISEDVLKEYLSLNDLNKKGKGYI